MSQVILRKPAPKCLNNRTLLKDTGYQTKLDTVAQYKFTLAFENSVTWAWDYVTEKFFDPLIAGSVPVYLGAQNIEELHRGSIASSTSRAFEIRERPPITWRIWTRTNPSTSRISPGRTIPWRLPF